MTTTTPTARPRERSMTWIGLIGTLSAFVLVPSLVSVIVFQSQSERLFPDAHAGLKVAVVHAVGTAIAASVITVKRWWPAVLRDRVPARAWVWAVPAVLAVLALALADVERVASAGGAIVAAVALGVLMIAIGEELMFRGIVVTFLRGRMGELGVALGSATIFGLAHILAGPVQVAMSMLFGFLLYLTRRVSRGIAIPIVVHLLWDLSVFTSFLTSTPDEGSDASLGLALATLVLGAGTLVLWRKVSPRSAQERVSD